MKKEKTLYFKLAMFGLGLLAVTHGNAQQDSVRTLDEVTITATRSEQMIIEVPRSVTVINRTMIENSAFNSVGEILSNHPGLYIVGAGQTPGTNQSIFMRGSNSNQVVVLIDGMRITDPSSPSAAIDLSELSLTNIERIEVIRGAHSTVYGGSAIGGAINIITRKGNNDGFHGSANVQAGTYGRGSASLAENLSVGYAWKNGLYVNGSLLNQNVSGWDATSDTIKTTGVFKTTDADDFRKTDLYLKTGYRTDRWDTFVSFKNVDQHAEIDNGAYNDDDNAFVDFKRRLIDYSAVYKINTSLDLTFLGSWSDSRRKSKNDSSIVNSNGDYNGTYSDGNYFGKLFTNELLLRYRMNNLKAMIGGGQYRESMRFNTSYYSNAFGFVYESKVNYDSIKTNASTNYLFAQVTYEFNKFGITGGSRMSHHSKFGNAVTFELNPYYQLNNVLIYGSLSTGYNAPSLYQLYDASRGFMAFTTRGNPKLKPEESTSFEVGIKKEFANNSFLTLAAFRSHTRNAIEYVYLWNKETQIADLSFGDYLGDTYLNVTNQTVHGIEVSGKAEAGKFYLTGNLTALKGKIFYSPDDIVTEQSGGHHVQVYNYGDFASTEVETTRLSRRPQLTGYAEIGYKPLNTLSLAMALRHTGSRFDVMYDPDAGPFGALGNSNVKTYDLIDFSAAWQMSKSILVAGKIENITDEPYEEILGFQTRGRSGYLKIVYRW